MKSFCFSSFNCIVYWSTYRTFFPELGQSLRPIGDAFIHLIKMIVVPIVFTTIVIGSSGDGNMKKWVH